jgi:hypothetical protein
VTDSAGKAPRLEDSGDTMHPVTFTPVVDGRLIGLP